MVSKIRHIILFIINIIFSLIISFLKMFAIIYFAKNNQSAFLFTMAFDDEDINCGNARMHATSSNFRDCRQTLVKKHMRARNEFFCFFLAVCDVWCTEVFRERYFRKAIIDVIKREKVRTFSFLFSQFIYVLCLFFRKSIINICDRKLINITLFLFVPLLRVSSTFLCYSGGFPAKTRYILYCITHCVRFLLERFN